MPIITAGHRVHNLFAELMECITLQKTAIARIINTEGEKIQKHTAVAVNHEYEQLIVVNKSVDGLMKSLTDYEIILQCQLKLFAYCICKLFIEL